jgi:hypothetical protein
MWLASLLAVATAVAACSSSGSEPRSAASGTSPGGAAHRASAARPLPPTVCERKVVTAADVSALLAAPIGTKAVPGDPQSCQFEGGDAATMTISVRPGLGDVSVDAWIGGKMPVPSESVTGVGDRAAWQGTLRELIATKQNVLCDIQVTGSKASAEDVQKKVTSLCETIWRSQ